MSDVTPALPAAARPSSPPSHPLTPLAAIAAACALAAPLTMASEGKVNAGYRDPVGIVTSCYGHTGAGAVLGRRYTDAECESQFKVDQLEHGWMVAACVPAGTPLRARAAFTDFAFNGGGGLFCKSSMARLAKAGDMAGACKALELYVYAGHRVLPGLVTRRRRERELCETGRVAL